MRKRSSVKKNERGAALAIAILVMVILLGFAALALSRATSETRISSVDAAESRTFSAAEAALEDTTRDFATRIENKLVLTPTDVQTLENTSTPYFSDEYDFVKKIEQIGGTKTITLTKGQFQGLISQRDEWQIKITAKEKATGVETVVRRRFFNDRVPIFQFGAFYQDDIEVNDPPTFVFNGRIHTNGNFFTNSNGSDIRYKSKVTIAGELIRDRWKNGAALDSGNGEASDNVYALNTTNADKQIKHEEGSVTCASGTGGILQDITGRNFPYPKCTKNSSWTSTISKNFEGNVVVNATKLNLPIYKLNVPLIEMIRRGKNVGDKANIGGTLKNVTDDDSGVLSKERFANKEGLRVTLADSQEKLPQCVDKTKCGVRLDGKLSSSSSSLGYQPKTMRGGSYKTTALNGNRFAIKNREVWIKIELVKFNADTQKPEIEDVTEDILSLGVTEPIITSSSPSNLQVKGYDTNTDSRSIIKLQRFAIEGDSIPEPSGDNYRRNISIGGNKYNFVTRIKGCKKDGSSNCSSDVDFASPIGSASTVNSDESDHYQLMSYNGNINTDNKDKYKIVPFPILLQDTREGNRENSTSNLSNGYVFKNGVMSLVDIDVANLRKFFNGDFDNYFPTDTPYAESHGNQPLKSTAVPENRGWVVYFSDRRGDANFDGRYDMEDVFPDDDDLTDEDLDNDGTILKASSTNEEAPYPIDSTVGAGYAAVTDHSYYRRGVRLINGGTLPGKYDYTSPTTTKGFTLASENGVYVWKDYNVTSISVASGSNSTYSNKYYPQGWKSDTETGTTDGYLHIPAAIIGDAVTILSNNWDDAKGFAYPNDLTKRVATETHVRFAMIAGDPITGRSPNDGLYGKQNGGLINFKRYLENWTNQRLTYSGSLINLYNAFNSNGRHKPNKATYNPPTRDWVFEESFKDPNRLPPGTPFVYFMTFTGFERLND